MTIRQDLSTPQAQVPDSIDVVPAPQELDSVAQATPLPDTLAADSVHHIPVESVESIERKDALPADTLVLQADTLPHAAPDDSLILAPTHFLEWDQGFFCNSPYWHPERPHHPMGFSCRPIPYRVSTDSPLTCGVLICFIMLIYILIRYGQEMRSQLHDFFLPTRVSQGRRQSLSTAQGLLSMPYVCLMLSIMGGIAISVIDQDHLGQIPQVTSRLWLQALFVITWWLYFLCKAYLHKFLNWIFFNRQVRHEWHNTQFLILTLEAVILFPVLLTMVYTYPSQEVFIYSILSVVILAKLLLLFTAIRLFYVKIYGALHLIVYFCTLEVAPLWVTIDFLTQIKDLL